MNKEEIFDGVFKFTNASDEDFIALWNNKEYKFPANSTCPLIIPNESLENIQEIRKRFAKKYAEREFIKSKEWKKIEKDGSKFLIPATYNEKILEPYIEQCLNPLPLTNAIVKDLPRQELELNGTKAIGDGKGTNLSQAFQDYVPPVLGQMSE